jgi:uncharacterized metal-binding protein
MLEHTAGVDHPALGLTIVGTWSNLLALVCEHVLSVLSTLFKHELTLQAQSCVDQHKTAPSTL